MKLPAGQTQRRQTRKPVGGEGAQAQSCGLDPILLFKSRQLLNPIRASRRS